MFPSFYRAILNAPLLANGTETEVFVNTLTTLTGEAITFSIFSPFTKGYIVVDPEAQYGTQPEIISFTGVDTSGVGYTGITRGLSAISTSSVTANKVYHGTGTPVIISWGNQEINDLITYVNSLVSGLAGNASITVAGVTKLDKTVASLPRAKSTLVSQNGSSGAMTVKVNPFQYVYNGTTYGLTTATASGTITAPVSNPRIDLMVYSTASVGLAIRTGTEGSSPTAPTPTEGDIVLATIYNRTGETKILEQDDSTNGYIQWWFEPTVYSAKTNLSTSQLSFGTDQKQTTTNTTYAVGESNLTGKHSIVANSFVPTVSGIQGVKLWKIADTGTFTGSVKIALQADSSGSPSGSDLASYTISNAAWLKLPGAAEFAIAFTSEYESMTVGGTYWIVISPSTSDNSNHPNLGYDNTSAHGLVLRYNNSADGWVTTSSACLYYKTTCGVVSKIVETDTTGLVPAILRPYALVALDTATVTNSTTTETLVTSVELEGGFFTLNSGIKVTSFIALLAAASTFTYKVKFNGSVISTWTITGVSYNSMVGTLTSYILNQSSLSSQKYSNMYMATSITNASTTGLAVYSLVTNGTTAVDLSQPGLLEVTIQVSNTSSSQTINSQGTVIEKIG